MKAHEMRSLANEELASRLTGWEEEYFRARCNKAVGQLQNTNVLPSLRHDIARAKTILNEKKKQAGQNAGSEENAASE